MYQRPPVPLPEVATDLLIQRVIVEQLVQFFEHWIDALCHLRHPRKHIFCFIAVDKHPAFLLHAVRACFLLSFLHVAWSERASQAHFAPQTSTTSAGGTFTTRRIFPNGTVTGCSGREWNR